MSTSVLSSIYDFDLLYREKHLGSDVPRLNDKRTVGIPLSNSNKNNKFNAAAYFRAGVFTDPLCGAKESAAAYMNKENKFRESLERAPPPSPLPLPLQDALQPRAAATAAQINSTRYKTELCRPFEESGSCKYGEKCQFAHGYHELRNLSRHPKYKTEPCRTFHTIGFCPYGPRCHFIHNVDERRPAPPPPALRRTDSDCSPFPAHRERERPRLHHSLSFSGFPSVHSGGGMMDLPTSRTPPPPSSSSSATACALAFLQDALSPGPRCLSAFPFPEQELKNFLDPLIPHVHSALSAQPPSPPFLPARGLLLDSPPVSPPLSDHESFSGSCCSSGTISGSESPNLDSNRRLPIFSRLSISDD